MFCAEDSGRAGWGCRDTGRRGLALERLAAQCILREWDHWLPFFPLSSVKLGLALKWRTTVIHEQGH